MPSDSHETARSSNVPDPWVGRTLVDRYTIVRKLGEGGLGTVYAATQLNVGREVAVKLLHADVASKGEHRQRFEREARTLARLEHPNIVGILDFGVEAGSSFLVMELVEGRTLAEVVAESMLPLDEAFDLGRQLLRALSFAHGQKIVHRDLKPANILVRRLPDRSLHLVVLDFGIAKFLEEDEQQPALTKQGAILGTPAYMAPEQATGGSARPMVDVYAAGLVLFELFTGRRPFVDTDRGALLRAHLMMPAPVPSTIRAELAAIAGLDGFLLKALEKKPANRFADALQMLEAFEGIVSNAQISRASTSPGVPMSPSAGKGGSAALPGADAPTPTILVETAITSPSAPAAPQPWRSSLLRRPALIAGAVGVGAIGLVVVGYLMTRFLAEPAAPAVPAPPVPTIPTVAVGAPAAGVTPFTRGVPDDIAVLHRTIVAGGSPSRDRLQVLYRYNAAHTQDARGQLLLGWTYVNRRWFSDATEAYREACLREPTSANDERLRADLVRVAGMPRFHGPAAATIESCLGRSALPAVEAAARGAQDAESRANLEALASRLR